MIPDLAVDLSSCELVSLFLDISFNMVTAGYSTGGQDEKNKTKT